MDYDYDYDDRYDFDPRDVLGPGDFMECTCDEDPDDCELCAEDYRETVDDAYNMSGPSAR